MKLSALVRKIDPVGRITLPVEIRRRCGIERNDGIEISIEGDEIIFSKYKPRCVFCGGNDNLVEHKYKHLCQECLISLTREI
ncbi:MAG: AbrB/MazE/SpoVT family DNA-binding domain-containing protein [Negativicutes bacterium]|nr:AbrB/MazE/SpoVT family DNA-binding domain-containing protein [Negativicutes bacterium]